MKSFSERNPFVIGAVGVAVTLAMLIAALELRQAAVLQHQQAYAAYFAEAGGLIPGAAVQVSGFEVGKVNSVELDKGRVLVTFNMDKKIRMGDRSEAAIKTKSLLGAKVLGDHTRAATASRMARYRSIEPPPHTNCPTPSAI